MRTPVSDPSPDTHPPLAPMDRIFGSFCAAMAALAVVAWWRGDGSPWAAAAIAVFALANALVSRLSDASSSSRAVEGGRLLMGTVAAPLAYVFAATPCGRWWPAFLIMCLGGTTIVVFFTGSRRPGLLLAGYYVALLVLTDVLVSSPVDWYALLTNAGVVAMTGLLTAEIASLFAQEKARSLLLLKREARDELRASEERFRRIVEMRVARANEEALREANQALELRVQERTADLEAALGEQRRLAAIIEATSDYVGIADLEGRSVYINEAGRRMIGLGPGIQKGSVADCYPPHALGKAREMLETALRGEVWSGEIALYHADGHEIPVSEVTFPLPGEGGRPALLATIIRDITVQKRVEADLREAKEAAEAASRAKSTFLANMSHEIRTPMNAVIGMTGLLLDTPLDARQRDFVEVIRTGSDALLAVIDDILDFSKIEAGRLEIRSETFDLRSCLESAMDLLAPRAAEKRLNLSYTMSADCPEALVGDVTRLRQVLVNLVGNAVKFTDQGEVTLSVAADAPGSGEQRTLRFAVRDTGRGIRPEERDRLFRSFSQLDASTTREHGGTGLGLAISKRLAELMGGTMWVTSDGVPGLGSTFHFTIEAAEAAAPQRAHLSRPQPVVAGRRALIVDDSVTNRRILRLQLQTWGMSTVEAASASEALSLLARGSAFDVAILDHHMPDRSGLELGTEVSLRHPGLRLVLLTSVGLPCKESAESVFQACLTKPVKPSQLHDTLVALFAEAEGVDGAGVEGSDAGRGAQAAAGPRPFLPLRILLAEDVALNRRFALSALETMGLTADVAVNGLEVLAALRRKAYDVVLMDMQMPEMDGLAATRCLREQVPASEQPYVIAMTANAMRGDREICLEAGMDDYVSKPVYLDALRAALTRAGQARGLSSPVAAPAALPADAATLDAGVVEGILRRPFAAETIALFSAEGRDAVGTLTSALGRGCRESLGKAAHLLKGSSLYVGAVGVVDLCRAIEEGAARGGSLASLGTLVEHVERELEHVLARLRRRLEEGAAS